MWTLANRMVCKNKVMDGDLEIHFRYISSEIKFEHQTGVSSRKIRYRSMISYP